MCINKIEALWVFEGQQAEVTKLEVQLLEVERAVVKQTKALMAHWRGRIKGPEVVAAEKEASV